MRQRAHRVEGPAGGRCASCAADADRDGSTPTAPACSARTSRTHYAHRRRDGAPAARSTSAAPRLRHRLLRQRPGAAGRAQGVLARAVCRRRVHVAQRRRHPGADARVDGQRSARVRHSRRIHRAVRRARSDAVVGWWPITRDNQLVAARCGAVIAQSRVGIPSNFLFRTGGDTTVRGYAFESLGVQQGDAIVGGRYYSPSAASSSCTGSTARGAWLRSSTRAMRRTRCPSFVPRWATASARACAPRSARSASTSRTASRTRASRLHFSVGLTF